MDPGATVCDRVRLAAHSADPPNFATATWKGPGADMAQYGGSKYIGGRS